MTATLPSAEPRKEANRRRGILTLGIAVRHFSGVCEMGVTSKF
jgi:hypothetical protein